MDLKVIQDAEVLSLLIEARQRRILEIGGGDARVLTVLAAPGRSNELRRCRSRPAGKWVIDSYHRLVPRNGFSDTWHGDFDVISVGSFSD